MSVSRIKIAGVAGNPISHSLSPRLHGYWLKKYDLKGDYVAFHVATNELPEFMKRLRINNIEGINLTVPHKEHAMSLVDELDDQAKKIGAVNTVYFNKDGKLVGSNTDGYGFLKHLKTSVQDWSAKKGRDKLVVKWDGNGTLLGRSSPDLESVLEDAVKHDGLVARPGRFDLRGRGLGGGVVSAGAAAGELLGAGDPRRDPGLLPFGAVFLGRLHDRDDPGGSLSRRGPRFRGP